MIISPRPKKRRWLWKHMDPRFTQQTVHSFWVATYFSKTLSEDLPEVICSLFTRWIINSHTHFAKPIKKGMLWIIPPSSQQQFPCSLFTEQQGGADRIWLENLHYGQINNTRNTLSKAKNIIWTKFLSPYLLSFWVIVPFSSLPAMEPKTLLASFAKSKSRTSAGETGTIAKASLSSFTGEVPI